MKEEELEFEQYSAQQRKIEARHGHANGCDQSKVEVECQHNTIIRDSESYLGIGWKCRDCKKTMTKMLQEAFSQPPINTGEKKNWLCKIFGHKSKCVVVAREERNAGKVTQYADYAWSDECLRCGTPIINLEYQR